MGMIGDAARSAKDSPATPILGVVSEPADYVCALDGSHVAAAEVDLVSRLMFMQQAHKTYAGTRSEEHTSELQSLMRISYAVFCLKKKKKEKIIIKHHNK